MYHTIKLREDYNNMKNLTNNILKFIVGVLAVYGYLTLMFGVK